MSNRGCCGGSETAQRILEAKGFWLNGGLSMADAQDGDELVRLDFIGLQSGSARYVGKVSGNVYIFGNNADDRSKLVDARDVDHFLNLRDPNTKKAILERSGEDPDKKAAKELKAKKEAAPAGFEWDEESSTYQPIGLRLVNGRWTPVAEITANGVAETGESNSAPTTPNLNAGDGDPADLAPKTGEVTDPNATTADQTASDNAQTAAALKNSKGGKASDLPNAKS